MKEAADIQAVHAGEAEDCVVCADCLNVMTDMPESCIDTIITDPPYGLKFMGKDWDHGIPGEHYWAEALRVAKPGAMLMAFGGTRTHHRLMVAIEDAGWEIRDCMMWLYGSGFPKSLDISKAIDKAAGSERPEATVKTSDMYGEYTATKTLDAPADSIFSQGEKKLPATVPATVPARQWQGWGTALKPAWEPIIIAMKPLDGTFAQNAEKHGVAGLNIDGGRIKAGDENTLYRKPSVNGCDKTNGRFQKQTSKIIGSMNDAYTQGRWPANLILDEESSEMLDEQSGFSSSKEHVIHVQSDGTGRAKGKEKPHNTRAYTSSGGASRFFYCAKACRAERNAGLDGMEEKQPPQEYRLKDNDGERATHSNAPRANHHPTVKPLAVMEYLCRLTATPTGGIVLDPFCGSGSTGIACVTTGRKFIGIDISEEYCQIARKRIEHAKGPLFV